MGTFELTFRLPFNREQEQLLRNYAASPEAVTGPADTLTFGEVTLKIDGRVVRPPWSTRKKLPFTDTDWVFGLVVRFANAVLGLRTGEPRQYVHSWTIRYKSGSTAKMAKSGLPLSRWDRADRQQSLPLRRV